MYKIFIITFKIKSLVCEIRNVVNISQKSSWVRVKEKKELLCENSSFFT